MKSTPTNTVLLSPQPTTISSNPSYTVPQTFVTVPISDTIKATVGILQEDVAEHGNRSKSMVFCTTAMGTSATAQLLKKAGYGTLPQVFEIHSRMTQSKRLWTAQKFKAATNAILVTSDVTARGMDFPG
jgi:ATP-dependent RNA helicase MSS116